MQRLRLAAVLGGALLWASPAAADVYLTIGNGHVSISAANATVRQILAEWAKVGQTRIINLDRVVGPPATVEIANATEVEALEILLRSVGGYILAPRQTDAPGASRFDRILILPVSSVPASGMGRPPTAASAQPTFPQPQLMPTPRRPDEAESDGQERAAAPASAPQGQPTANQFPRPAIGMEGRPQTPTQERSIPPAPPPAPSSTLTAPAGVAVPGMVAPTPTPPNPSGSMPR